MPDQARFLDFMDMIDGGGAGRMGDKFEGGGIFSALANLVATPYGSEDPTRRARREAAYRAAGLLAPEEAEAAPAAAPAVTRGGTDISNLRPQLRPDNFMTEAQKEQVVMNQPVGNGYPDMSMPAIAGYTTPAPAPATDPYAPLGGSNPAVQAEIARRQEAQRMMQYEPMGSGGAAAAMQADSGYNAIEAQRPLNVANQSTGFAPAQTFTPDVAPVPPMSEQLAPIAPATSMPQYPSGMSPRQPEMPQGVMSFRDFVDAERAAMSGADRYLDPENYRRGYARYLISMGIRPEMMGM